MCYWEGSWRYAGRLWGPPRSASGPPASPDPAGSQHSTGPTPPSSPSLPWLHGGHRRRGWEWPSPGVSDWAADVGGRLWGLGEEEVVGEGRMEGRVVCSWSPSPGTTASSDQGEDEGCRWGWCWLQSDVGYNQMLVTIRVCLQLKWSRYILYSLSLRLLNICHFANSITLLKAFTSWTIHYSTIHYNQGKSKKIALCATVLANWFTWDLALRSL